MRQFPRSNRRRNGIPLQTREAIFPENQDTLHWVQVDVLATHEAPSCHPRGFVGINMAADSVSAGLVVQGRRHESAGSYTPSRVAVRGLRQAEVFLLRTGEFT